MRSSLGTPIQIQSKSELSNVDKAGMLEAYVQDGNLVSTEEREFALVGAILDHDLNGGTYDALYNPRS